MSREIADGRVSEGGFTFWTADSSGSSKINWSGNTADNCASLTGSVASSMINGVFEARK